MEFSSAPGPRRRQLATGLVHLRERAGLSQQEAGNRAGCSKATVSRYEDWRHTTGIRWGTVKNLAEACEATPQELAALVQLAKDLAENTEGWWVGNDSVPQWLHPLITTELTAREERVWANSVIPGLLQTRGYALAIHEAQEVPSPAEQIEKMVDARIARQSVLQRTPPLHLRVVLDQAVLQRKVGSAKVMAGQLDHLRAMTRLPHVDLQILPFDAGAHAAGMGHFVMLGGDIQNGESATSTVANVVYVEMLAGGLYLDGEAEVARYTLAFDSLREQAENTACSLELLAIAREGYQ